MKKVFFYRGLYTIACILQSGYARKDICIAIGKDKSVLSHELKRNSSKRVYSPFLAQEYAKECKERFERKRKLTESIREYIVTRIEGRQWSPEQIVGDTGVRGLPMVSNEQIYQFIRNDKRSGGRLCKHCRHRLKHCKRTVGGKKIVIPDKVSIDDRPGVINEKKQLVDWEIDTIVGPEKQGRHTDCHRTTDRPPVDEETIGQRYRILRTPPDC